MTLACVGRTRKLEARATLLNRIGDQIFSHIHRQRERLHHKTVAVSVDDYPGKSVAFAPNNAAKPWVDPSPRTVFCRLCDSAFEEIQIQVLFPTRETARH